MAEHLKMERFADNATAALHNESQRRALRAAVDVFDGRRQSVLESSPDWQQWRTQARAVKDHVLAHLDHYLAAFEEHATARGTIVHWARDAAEARAIVVAVCKDAGATLAVKSKSMTTEEVHLNGALETAGVEAVETDLGEWIQQLADEVPFHIVVPAIHKNRKQIAQLFAEKIGTASDADVETLTLAARDRLRSRFAAAGIGISGANFMIAETGSILILENEGNARLTTSVPRVHVAMVGIEKVLPRVADLDVFLRLLPRSGTGQQITTYQSLLTGPKTSPDAEGPETLHVVLLDNGRSRMLREEVTRQSLACIRCGACLNVCPVYQQVGGHAYGSVYPGPIGAVITPQLAPLDKAAELPFASSLCGACRDVCPVAIDIPRLLLHLRKQIREGDGQRPAARPKHLERLTLRFMAFLMRGPGRYRAVMAIARLGDRLLGPLLHRLPPIARWRRGRTVPRLAHRDFRTLWKTRQGEGRAMSAREAIFDAVRQQLGRQQASPPAPPPPVPMLGRVDLEVSERVELFARKLEEVSDRCHSGDPATTVADILAHHGPCSIATSDAPQVEQLRRDPRLCTASWLRPDATQDELFAADVGITAAQWAIAETGTIALESATERNRLASLIPPIHIALVPASRILCDLGELLKTLDRPLSHAVTLITGPSRTADIELQLVLGVHGPRELHVVLV